MGGFQTVYSGFVHPDQFVTLGVFSAGLLGEPEPLEQALEKPEKISASIHYFYVTTGSKDPITGPRPRNLSLAWTSSRSHFLSNHTRIRSILWKSGALP
jgi:hypothetical protein